MRQLLGRPVRVQTLPQAFTVWFGVSYLILQDSLTCKMGGLRVPLSEMPAGIWGDYTWKAPPFMVSPQEMFAIIMVMTAAAVAFVVVVLVVIIVIVVIVIWPLPASPHYFLCQFLSLDASPRLKEATPRPLHVLKGSLPSFCCHCCEGAEEPLEGMS